MLPYKDTLPAITTFLNNNLDVDVYGNMFPPNVELPAVLVKPAGGTDFTRLQFLARADDDIQAMEILIEAMNMFEQHGAERLNGLMALWISREMAPISSIDGDTNKPEAWVYMRLEHYENQY